MKKSIGFLFTIVLSAIGAHADSIYLGKPAYGGTGCPAGTASVALSPDKQSVSMLFDQYVAEAGNGISLDRKSCNIAIPVHVPQGFSVSIFAIDYRGYMHLPSGARARLAVNYFLPGDTNGVNSSKSFTGPYDSDYLKSDSLGLAATVWSGCGVDTILRANTSMLVTSNSRQEDTLGTVDSADIKSGIVYHLQWRTCP